jgi:alpha-beta hydrolase superfamily lysophospholipase
VGDAILAVGDDPVHTTADFVSRIKAGPVGRPIIFKIQRDGVLLSLPIILAAAPDEQDPLVDTLYQSVSIDGTLRRTLITVPKAATGRRPAVLIVGGIGCFTVDNAADPEDSYMRLAHDLSRKGFVVMRLEKSGVGDSQGPPCLAVDLLTEMHSYEVALAELEGEAHVNRDAVYLFGHSIGTLMVPRIASQSRIAGVIVADGVGRNWIEYELSNLRRQLELAAEPPAQVDATLAAKEVCMHRLLIAKEDESEIERTHPECKEHNNYPAPASYMQQAASLNIAEPWTKVSAPLLAIYGTADFVTTEADHRRIASIVNAIHPGAATLMLVPGMDHHFDLAGTPQQAYDLRVRQRREAPYDEDLSGVVTGWLCAREKCSGLP